MNRKTVDLIRRLEGCRLRAYKCPAGVWTIGYGHTANVKEGDVITQEHKRNVMALETAAEVVGYDYRAGYPEVLRFEM